MSYFRVARASLISWRAILSLAFQAAQQFPILDFARRDTAGVREAVEHVFTVLSVPVFHYVISLVGNGSEAEDLTQEVFLRLCAELHDGRRIENVRAWCFKVAHNLAVSMGRRKQTAGEHLLEASAAGEPSTGANGIEETLVRREQSERVAAAMGTLTPLERQSLYLRTEGLLYREIADILNLRVPTVQTLLSRAMKKIVKEIHG
jgi:RNA polymerase sigma-70 factor, ECF subfamily